MDTPPLFSEQDKTVRLSQSPAGTPRYIDAPGSPVHSLHPKMEDSIHTQPDLGLRTTDFFDDSTDDDGSIVGQEPTPIAELEDRGRKRASTADSLLKDQSGYLGGPPANEFVIQCGDEKRSDDDMMVSNPLGNHQASMDGFLRLTHTPKPAHAHWPRDGRSAPDRPPRPEVTDPGPYDNDEITPITAQARPVSFQRTNSGRIIRNSMQPPPIPEEPSETSTAAVTVAVETAKDEHIMNAHTQTLQALLRDDSSFQQASARLSQIPDADRLTALPPMAKKRVSLAPPPLELATMHGSLPEEIVRTPYPIGFRKNYMKPSPLRTSMNIEHETILPLSIRRSVHQNQRPRKVMHIEIPRNIDAAVALSLGDTSEKTKEQHFEALDFDDSHFFRELQSAYHKLAGLFRFLSARTLQNIQISHSASCNSTCEAELSSKTCSHTTYPRSPRHLASQGLKDSFSEQELLRYFWSPNLGKARYAWVHWAKRLSSTADQHNDPAPVPPADSPSTRLAEKPKKSQEAREATETAVKCGECTAGLEFVEGWSARRIFLAIACVKVSALAAALCWIFLGSDRHFDTGYRDAGGRVEGGMMLGVFVLLTGWTTLLGWLGLSWLLD